MNRRKNAAKDLEISQQLSSRLPYPIIAFLLIMLLPHTLAFSAGPVLITTYRALMICLLPFILLKLSQGKAGLGTPDAIIVLFTIWSLICICMNYPTSQRIERSGQFVLEVTSAYFLSRTYMTNMEQLRSIVKPLFLITAVALVLAVPEAITHQKPIIEYTSKMTGVSPGFYSDGTDVRLGLRRAQAFFENPILFGLFCATCISLVWYNEERLKTRLTKIIVIAAATFISLSSAPLLAMTSQVLMLTIERITRRLNNRILILSALSLTILLGLNAFTKSGPFGLIINYLTFNQASSYNRVLIWDYGLQNISDHPFFGIVPEDWYRAPWMKVSIDNFWIYTGLLSGFVGWALIASAIILIMWRFGQVPLKNLSVKHIGFRRGWAIAMIAFVLTGFSVMFFGKLQPYFYFMVGIGAAGARIYAADSAQKTKQIMDQKRARVREQMDRLADARRTVAVHP